MDPNKKDSFLFFDIAANLCDEQFQGIYHNKKYHDDDTDEVISRSLKMGVKKMLFASGNIEDMHLSYKLSQKANDFYTTCGIHPCYAGDAYKVCKDIESHFNEMRKLIPQYKDKIIAVGECGLDYDRLHYSKKEEQLLFFSPHFDIAKEFSLPMYFHNRSTGDDFYTIVKENRHKFTNGVVHSFTELQLELNRCIELGLFIGVNGCSLKTKENLELIKTIPLDRLTLETDCPYCEIKSSSAAYNMVDTKFNNRVKKEKMRIGSICKDRNEPCFIIQVLEVVSKIKAISKEELAKICYDNANKVFNLKE